MKKQSIYAGIVLVLLIAALNPKAIAAIVQGWWDFAEQSSLTNPATGYRRLGFKTDGKLYSRSSAGVETEIGAGGGGTDLSNPSGYPILDEFPNGNVTNHGVGTHGWSWVAYAGGGLDANATPVSGLHGYVAGQAHGTNADSAAVLTLLYSDAGTITGSDWVWQTRAKLASTSNSRTWIGMGASASIVPARFLGFRYDTSSSYTDDTKGSTGRWVAQMCVSSGCSDTGGTYVVTSVASDTNFHLFEITKVGSTYTFKIDGTSRATFCASGCDTTVTAMNGYANIGFLSLGFETGAGYTYTYIDRFYFAASGLSR